MEIPYNELIDFASHFHLVPDLISPHALGQHTQSNAVPNQQVSFSMFLNVLADIAVGHCLKRDEASHSDPFGHIAAFKALLTIIDPKKVMFHSQLNPQADEESEPDASTIASVDVEDKNPFDTPFDSAAVDSPRGNPPPPPPVNTSSVSNKEKKEQLTATIEIFTQNVPYKAQVRSCEELVVAAVFNPIVMFSSPAPRSSKACTWECATTKIPRKTKTTITTPPPRERSRPLLSVTVPRASRRTTRA